MDCAIKENAAEANLVGAEGKGEEATHSLLVGETKAPGAGQYTMLEKGWEGAFLLPISLGCPQWLRPPFFIPRNTAPHASTHPIKMCRHKPNQRQLSLI